MHEGFRTVRIPLLSPSGDAARWELFSGVKQLRIKYIPHTFFPRVQICWGGHALCDTRNNKLVIPFVSDLYDLSYIQAFYMRRMHTSHRSFTYSFLKEYNGQWYFMHGKTSHPDINIGEFEDIDSLPSSYPHNDREQLVLDP